MALALALSYSPVYVDYLSTVSYLTNIIVHIDGPGAVLPACRWGRFRLGRLLLLLNINF
jgi:hypothetical protein